MRYFLDCEYNGFGGELISLALVPEHGDHEFYAVLELPEAVHGYSKSVSKRAITSSTTMSGAFSTKAARRV